MGEKVYDEDGMQCTLWNTFMVWVKQVPWVLHFTAVWRCPHRVTSGQRMRQNGDSSYQMCGNYFF